MDYKDKYIKYKTKYLELKDIDVNNQTGGGKNKLLFIMFPGNGVIKNGWDTIDFNNKTGAIKRNNFIKEIRKLGEIYFYEPKYYNIFHYSGGEGDDKWYGNDINFTKDDIDVDKICENIYNDVKDFNGKIVLLGHSMGAYFVYYFAQKYASKCLFGITIDGMFINSINQGNNEKKYYKDIEKYSKYTNDDINKLIEKVKKYNKKAFNELLGVYFHNIASYSKKIRKIKKFKIPMISFMNFNIGSNEKYTEQINQSYNLDIEKIRKYNNFENYKIITFVNKSHFPHLIEESKDIILENIKLMINKYTK